jgi:hypothetical protein
MGEIRNAYKISVITERIGPVGGPRHRCIKMDFTETECEGTDWIRKGPLVHSCEQGDVALGSKEGISSTPNQL